MVLNVVEDDVGDFFVGVVCEVEFEDFGVGCVWMQLYFVVDGDVVFFVLYIELVEQNVWWNFGLDEVLELC